jgi:hypothetical protein
MTDVAADQVDPFEQAVAEIRQQHVPLRNELVARLAQLPRFSALAKVDEEDSAETQYRELFSDAPFFLGGVEDAVAKLPSELALSAQGVEMLPLQDHVLTRQENPASDLEIGVVAGASSVVLKNVETGETATFPCGAVVADEDSAAAALGARLARLGDGLRGTVFIAGASHAAKLRYFKALAEAIAANAPAGGL